MYETLLKCVDTASPHHGDQNLPNVVPSPYRQAVHGNRVPSSVCRKAVSLDRSRVGLQTCRQDPSHGRGMYEPRASHIKDVIIMVEDVSEHCHAMDSLILWLPCLAIVTFSLLWQVQGRQNRSAHSQREHDG